jgi:murein DD-endopeptidase MepM/ murein hydrolase activator NlpD
MRTHAFAVAVVVAVSSLAGSPAAASTAETADPQGATATAAALAPAGLEVRFCPATRAYSWPLESRRGIHALVLQNVAVVNQGEPAELTAIELELLAGGGVVDSRRLAGDGLGAIAAFGPRLQGSGQMELLGWQFCGKALIAEGVQLGGPTLAAGQALLVAQQPFAFRGDRDALRVRAHARVAGRELTVEGTLPISTAASAREYRFPLSGEWFVAVGASLHTGHRWALPEEFGIDVVRLGEGGRTHRGDGTRFADYYAYGAPVLAAAPGRVVAALDGTPEDPATLRQPGETDDGFLARVMAGQMDLLARGAGAVAGNHVIVDHGGGEHSMYGHLQPGSVAVKVGDTVRAGQPIGRLGSSGNSTEPHLHFQVCDGPQPLACAGIPVEFAGVRLPFADYPRALQSGDMVVAE